MEIQWSGVEVIDGRSGEIDGRAGRVIDGRAGGRCRRVIDSVEEGINNVRNSEGIPFQRRCAVWELARGIYDSVGEKYCRWH